MQETEITKAMSKYQYPTDEQLKVIRHWDYRLGYKALIDYVYSLWSMSAGGFKLYRGQNKYSGRWSITKLRLHTNHWAGNKAIISALRENDFWGYCFYKEVAGGHFWFDIPRILLLPSRLQGKVGKEVK